MPYGSDSWMTRLATALECGAASREGSALRGLLLAAAAALRQLLLRSTTPRVVYVVQGTASDDCGESRWIAAIQPTQRQASAQIAALQEKTRACAQMLGKLDLIGLEPPERAFLAGQLKALDASVRVGRHGVTWQSIAFVVARPE